MRRAPLVFAAALALLQGCATRPAPGRGVPDAPVAAGEPRETLHVEVDLPRSAGCEEMFDVALYESRGVDLVQWDERSTRCAGRRVTIRYLPRLIARDALLQSIQRHSERTKVNEQ